MRSLGSLTAAILARHAGADRAALMAAHEHAAEFHAAIASALDAESELDGD